MPGPPPPLPYALFLQEKDKQVGVLFVALLHIDSSQLFQLQCCLYLQKLNLLKSQRPPRLLAHFPLSPLAALLGSPLAAPPASPLAAPPASPPAQPLAVDQAAVLYKTLTCGYSNRIVHNCFYNLDTPSCPLQQELRLVLLNRVL